MRFVDSAICNPTENQIINTNAEYIDEQTQVGLVTAYSLKSLRAFVVGLGGWW